MYIYACVLAFLPNNEAKNTVNNRTCIRSDIKLLGEIREQWYFDITDKRCCKKACKIDERKSRAFREFEMSLQFITN